MKGGGRTAPLRQDLPPGEPRLWRIPGPEIVHRTSKTKAPRIHVELFKLRPNKNSWRREWRDITAPSEDHPL